MEIPHSVSLLDGLELCTSHVRSISTKPLTRAAELCDAVPKGACFAKFCRILLNFGQILAKFFRDFSKMQHFLKIGGKRYGEVRNFKKVRKFASSNLKFRSSKFKFTEILICNPGKAQGERGGADGGGIKAQGQ